jgi:hypothetical protein
MHLIVRLVDKLVGPVRTAASISGGIRSQASDGNARASANPSRSYLPVSGREGSMWARSIGPSRNCPFRSQPADSGVAKASLPLFGRVLSRVAYDGMFFAHRPNGGGIAVHSRLDRRRHKLSIGSR